MMTNDEKDPLDEVDIETWGKPKPKDDQGGMPQAGMPGSGPDEGMPEEGPGCNTGMPLEGMPGPGLGEGIPRDLGRHASKPSCPRCHRANHSFRLYRRKWLDNKKRAWIPLESVYFCEKCGEVFTEGISILQGNQDSKPEIENKQIKDDFDFLFHFLQEHAEVPENADSIKLKQILARVNRL